MIVLDTGFPFKNTPQYKGIDFCETNVRYVKCKTELVTDHYLEQNNADYSLPIHTTPKHAQDVSTDFSS